MTRLFMVARGSGETLTVEGEHGEMLVRCNTSVFKPESAEAAKARPWFFTTSPFGPQIVGMAWERSI